MAIELSNLTFTDENDIVPASGDEQIVNTGIANTLAGNDGITGTGDDEYGFKNVGTLNTDDGNDTIIGQIGFFQSRPVNYGIFNSGTLNTGEGNDVINGSAFFYGISNSGTLNTGEGDDVITGSSRGTGIYSAQGSIFDTGGGNDLIRTGNRGYIDNYSNTFTTGDGNDTIDGGFGGIYNAGLIDTGNGEDYILSSNGLSNDGGVFLGEGNDSINAYDITTMNGVTIYNEGSIDTSDGNDSIIYQGNFINKGNVFLGEGNDSIATSFYVGGVPDRAIENFNAIDTGDGDDTITTDGVIYNEGIINTGSGDDSILVNGGVDNTGVGYGIYNNGGAINTGDGNDSIIANGGFESGPNSSGSVFLGEGEDYIKGYGSGDFYGGNGNDTLELTPGTYTVGIWGEAGESPIFTKGNQLMITSEFEKLKAGNILYDFTSLTAGQIITVA